MVDHHENLLDIVYQDDDLVAINKPHGLLVHPSSLARDAPAFALQMLRDQLGCMVYPAHRIDRKTGGVLLFSLKKEVNPALQRLFADRLVEKKYLAILRGYTPTETTIDYPLKKENGMLQDAVTHLRTLSHGEIDLPFGGHSTSRYSLVEALPETGRMHQLRRHFAHILHPIIGDRPHGCNKQNRLWKDTFAMDTMLLHASELSFKHPISGQPICIRSNPQSEFLRVARLINFEGVDHLSIL
ncbi:tRNA pseudouridine65 synthase [bacterium A37T11]|nr:tRNA pseudouridine65 synthase [bacterium A37T11]